MRTFFLTAILICMLTPAEAQTREEILDRLPENAVFRFLVHQKAVRVPVLRSLKRLAGEDGVLDRTQVDARRTQIIASKTARKLSVAGDLDLDNDGALLARDIEKLMAHEDRRYTNQLKLMIAQGADGDSDGEITGQELTDWAERTARDDRSLDEISGADFLSTYDLDADERVDATEVEEFLRLLWQGYHGPAEAPLCALPRLKADRLFVYAGGPAGGAGPVVIPTRFRANLHSVVAVLSGGGRDVVVENPSGGRVTVIIPDGIKSVSGVAPDAVVRVAGAECLQPAAESDGAGRFDVRRGQIAHATGVKEADLVRLTD